MGVVKEIATEMGCSYIYDDFGRINLYADRCKKFPLIAEVIPAEGNINTRLLPITQVTRTTIVAFLTPCELDFNGEEVGNNVDAMLDVCRAFLARYQERVNEPLPDEMRYNVVLDFLDKNLCGVRVTLPMVDDGGCK